MTPAELSDILKSNQSLRQENRHLADPSGSAFPRPAAPPERLEDAPRVNTAAATGERKAEAQIKTPKQPNKTEAEYGRILESEFPGCPVIFEGIRLKWGGDMHYTPDWLVIRPGKWLLIEIKGGWIWSRDSVRFKGCKAEWSEHFEFRLWQKSAGTWARLY